MNSFQKANVIFLVLVCVASVIYSFVRLFTIVPVDVGEANVLFYYSMEIGKSISPWVGIVLITYFIHDNIVIVSSYSFGDTLFSTILSIIVGSIVTAIVYVLMHIGLFSLFLNIIIFAGTLVGAIWIGVLLFEAIKRRQITNSQLQIAAEKRKNEQFQAEKLTLTSIGDDGELQRMIISAAEFELVRRILKRNKNEEK